MGRRLSPVFTATLHGVCSSSLRLESRWLACQPAISSAVSLARLVRANRNANAKPATREPAHVLRRREVGDRLDCTQRKGLGLPASKRVYGSFFLAAFHAAWPPR